MSAVIRIRPDLDELTKDLEKGIPDSVRKGAKEAEREAERSFKRVGDQAGDALEKGIEGGIGDGLKQGADGRWRDAKGKFVKIGDEAGKAVGAGIEKGIDDAAKRSGTSLTQKIDAASSKALKTGAVMTAGMTIPLAMLGKSAADAAISYEDAIAANEQLFGKKGLAVINEWGKTHADAYNVAQKDVQLLSQGFAGYMQAYGDEQTAAVETTKLLERLADARSFYGGRTEDKASAVAAMLRGEYDPMETAFPGVSIKQSDVVKRAQEMGLLTVSTTDLAVAQAAVAKAEERVKKARGEGGADTKAITAAETKVAEAKRKVAELEAAGKNSGQSYANAVNAVTKAEQALSKARSGKGGAKGSAAELEAAEAALAKAKEKADEASQGAADSMTKEARVMASLNLLYEQTNVAMGDVARTQDQTANKIENARQQWEDMKLELGQQLLPIIGELAPKFADLFEQLADEGVFEDLVPAIESLARAGAQLLEFFSDLPSWVQTAILGMAAFGGPALTLLGTIGKLIGGFGKLKAAMSGAQLAGGLSGAGAGAAGAAGAGAAGGSAAAGAAGGGLLAAARTRAVPYAVAGYVGTKVGGSAGKALYENSDGYKSFIDGLADTWFGEKVVAPVGGFLSKFDDGGVMGGAAGVHAPAMVAGDELMVPTHKKPLPDALRAVGLTVNDGAGNTAVLERIAAGIEAAAAAPRTVTVVAPPGMPLDELAEKIDEISRTGGSRRSRPAANRL